MPNFGRRAILAVMKQEKGTARDRDFRRWLMAQIQSAAAFESNLLPQSVSEKAARKLPP
jgi:hypothetical protein